VVIEPTAAMLIPKLSAVAPAGTAGVVQVACAQLLDAAKAGLCVQYTQLPLEFW
jgi:hypothetical protein